MIAYRVQADDAGDLDPGTLKLLDRLGRGEIADIPMPELRAVKPGTLLVREWEGTAPARHGVGERVRLERGHLREPVQGCPRHHRD